MKKISKVVSLFILLLALAGIGAWYYVFVWSANHHRNAENEKGIPVAAAGLVDLFEKSEQMGDSIYLDKALEITGEVAYVKLNQAGRQTVMLKSGDPMAGVLCTLKRQSKTLKEGEAITLKGICTGFLSDVVITDAVVLKDNNSIK